MVEFPLALLEGLPAWVRASLVAFIVLGVLALRILNRLIPQNSRDRLSWWRAVLQHLRERADRKRLAPRQEEAASGNRRP
ncbi:hypothetical protein [Streptomyces sp. CBMA123]|uniref:hypothetical protein n=1 Tax=Streptomyces sp. CBMA123 TaxID=1896313 RepID=UPI0016620FDE|nr:hypothetical protein [Streptomyces sp. CBMA123]MBD0694931.1 hypothetical protein [Streptomyces sp. CBMA123]